MFDTIQKFDWRVLDVIRDTLSCVFLDAVMPVITYLGNSGAIWILCAVIMLFTRRYRKKGVLTLCALAAGFLLGNLLIKNIAARPRPFELREGIELLIKQPGEYSFPSGHALSSTIGAAMLTYADRRFGYAAIPLAMMIAFSRLYLYVHFPTDVLSACVLGLFIACTAVRAFKRIENRKE